MKINNLKNFIKTYKMNNNICFKEKKFDLPESRIDNILSKFCRKFGLCIYGITLLVSRIGAPP